MADWERAFPLFEKHGASATFFICREIGSNEVAFARRALSMGHEVGLHGFKHRNADDAVFVPAAQQLTSLLIGNVIMGENYHTDIEDIMRAMRRAGERAETLSIVSHGIRPDARGISMKTEWLERMLSEANACGVVVRGVR